MYKIHLFCKTFLKLNSILEKKLTQINFSHRKAISLLMALEACCCFNLFFN